MGKITLLTDARQFRVGLVCGLDGIAAVFVLGATRTFGRRPAVAGTACAVAALAVLQGWGPWGPALRLPQPAMIAVALLAVGGIGTQVLRPGNRLTTGMAMLVPGGVLLGLALADRAPAWAAIAAAFTVVVGGGLAADLDHFHRRRSLGPLLFVVTVAGVYLTVPDTEGARALLGATIPLLLLVVPKPTATLGAAGIGACFGILAWIAVIEGIARPGAVVGALGCLGLFVAEPLARRVVPGLRERDGHGPTDHLRNTAVAFVLQTVVVVWASRVAGFAHDALPATFALIPALGAGMLLSRYIPAPPLPVDRTLRVDRRG